MKKILFLFILLLCKTILIAQDIRTANVVTAGDLQTVASSYLNTVTDLTITGNIDARDFKTMRDNMPSLETIDISAANIEAYTGTAGTGDAISITYPALEIPKFAFCSPFTWSGKTTLTEVTLPSTITAIGENAFRSCTGLNTSLSLPNSIETIGAHAYDGCNAIIGSLTFPTSITSIGTDAFKNCSSLTGALTIPSTISSISNFTFQGCSGFTSVSIPTNITSIGDYAFYNCSGLLGNLTLPNTLISIGESAFRGCNKLSGALVIPNSVTSIGADAFRSCNGFNGTLTLSNSITQISNNTFNGCTKFIGNIEIPNSVTSIGNGAFIGCFGFNGGINLPTSLLTIGDEAFRNCINVSGALTIPNSVTSIGNYAFDGCTNLSGTASIPASVSSIGNQAFTNFPCNFSVDASNANYSSANGLLYNKTQSTLIQCPISKTGLYEIPSTVTTIGNDAFRNCTSLTSITIPNTVTSIMDNAFWFCNNLTSITSFAITPIDLSSSVNVFNGVNTATCNLYVPHTSVTDYENANQWQNFTNIIALSQTIVFNTLSSKTYGDIAFTISATGGNSGNPVVFTSSNPLIATCTGTNGETITILRAGTCTIYANQIGDAIYLPATQVSQNLVIHAKPITVTADANLKKDYGNIDPILSYTVSPALVNGDVFIGNLARVSGESINSYPITLGTLSAGTNYAITFNANSFEITSRKITVTVSTNLQKTYGDADPALAYTYSPSLIGMDAFTGAIERTAGEDAGSYPVSIGTLALPANYSILFIANNVTINPKPITVTVDANQEKVYGAAEPSLTYTYSPALLGGDSFTGNIERTPGNTAGTYPISIGTLTAGSNYAINFVPNTFEITPITITVTPNSNQQKTYGDAEPNLSYTFSPALLGADAFTGFLSRVSGNNAGTYAITLGTLSAGNNYVLQLSAENFTILKKAITITTTANQQITYGDTEPALAYSVSPALVSGDAFTGTLSRQTGNNVGTYAISIGSLSPGNNYSVTFVPNNFVIVRKNVSITAVPESKEYDGTNSAVVNNITFPGVLSNDDVSLSLGTATFINKEIGIDKEIIIVGSVLNGADAPNYNLLPITGLKASITPVQLTMSTAEIISSKMYDGTTSVVISKYGSVDGIIPNDDVQIATSAAYKDASVGINKEIIITYTINGTDAGNYLKPLNDTIKTAKIFSVIAITADAVTTPTVGGCQNKNMAVSFTVESGMPAQYQILFNNDAKAAGFSNIAYTNLPTNSGDISILLPIPSNIKEGLYNAQLQLKNEIGVESSLYNFSFTINLASSYIIKKASEVLLIDNSDTEFASYQWYKNDVAIEGATNQFYKDFAGIDGEYYVAITTQEGTTYRTCSFSTLPTSISDIEIAVKIFPNPATANKPFIVELPINNLENATLFFTDISGKVVYSVQDVKQQNSIVLPQGMYIGSIQNKSGKSISFKVVVTN